MTEENRERTRAHADALQGDERASTASAEERNPTSGSAVEVPADDAVSADANARVEREGDAPATERRDAAARPLPDDALVILPVRNVVMFPGAVFPLTVGREKSQAAVQEAVRLERPLGVLLQSKPDIETPGAEDLHWVGTSATVLRYVTTPDGLHHAIARGGAGWAVRGWLVERG